MSLFCYLCSLSLSDENPCLQLQEHGRNGTHLLCHPLWHQRRLPGSAFGNVSHGFSLLGSGQRTSGRECARACERLQGSESACRGGAGWFLPPVSLSRRSRGLTFLGGKLLE